ncbi:MAG TPA: DUF6600 domain-containing protein [Ignavibacteria bacterium]|nr:DUF6600 domain-containing protein [Ignavibacteria bacterium]
MKTIIRIKNFLAVSALSLALLFTVNSSLYSQQQYDKEVDDDEDLFDASTDYKSMYDDLSSDGEWIQLTKAELTEQTSDEDGTGSGYSSNTEADNFTIVFVWQPRGYHSGWTPYSNGRWIYTDYNWYWHSYYKWGWAPYHYGRWVYSAYYGWIWIPGRHWAPSWVDWCYSDYHVGWYPRYPRFHRTFSYHRYYERHYTHWVFVERHKMLDPKINSNLIVSSELNKDLISKSSMTTQTNKYLNGKIVSAGPPVQDIEKTMGKKIDVKHINYTESKEDSKVVKSGIYAYKPDDKSDSKNTGNKQITNVKDENKNKDANITGNGNKEKTKDLTSESKLKNTKSGNIETGTKTVKKKEVTKTKQENTNRTGQQNTKVTKSGNNSGVSKENSGTKTSKKTGLNKKSDTGSREKNVSKENTQKNTAPKNTEKKFSGSKNDSGNKNINTGKRNTENKSGKNTNNGNSGNKKLR